MRYLLSIFFLVPCIANSEIVPDAWRNFAPEERINVCIEDYNKSSRTYNYAIYMLKEKQDQEKASRYLTAAFNLALQVIGSCGDLEQFTQLQEPLNDLFDNIKFAEDAILCSEWFTEGQDYVRQYNVYASDSAPLTTLTQALGMTEEQVMQVSIEKLQGLIYAFENARRFCVGEAVDLIDQFLPTYKKTLTHLEEKVRDK